MRGVQNVWTGHHDVLSPHERLIECLHASLAWFADENDVGLKFVGELKSQELELLPWKVAHT
jgi:hypothetical protein